MRPFKLDDGTVVNLDHLHSYGPGGEGEDADGRS